MVETSFTFFGVRGSYPVADKSVNKYGGNTTCLLVENGNDIIIFDAGTGIINLGEYIKEERKEVNNINIFITHYHLDHLMGLSFFYPLSDKKYSIKIYYPNFEGVDADSVLFNLFEPPYSPIGKDGILADIELIPLNIEDNKKVNINNDLNIRYFYESSHPIHGVFVYKVISGDKNLVFATDIEPDKKSDRDLKDFMLEADVLIHDAQYLKSDYHHKDTPTKGYGHSTIDMAVNNAIACKVERLYLFHHNPSYSDTKLEEILDYAKGRFNNTYLAQEYKKNIL